MSDDELKELRAIKKLLILLLKVNKVGQQEIARALGVTQPSISKMLNPKMEESPEEQNQPHV